MRVLCIDASNIPVEGPGTFTLKEGETYEVLDECVQFGQRFYLIDVERIFFEMLEVQNWFNVNRFIPLSEVLELEIYEKYEILF